MTLLVKHYNSKDVDSFDDAIRKTKKCYVHKIIVFNA